MITVRYIERLFSGQQHPRLYRELIAGRPEAAFALQALLARPVAIAALGMLRLDELSQSLTSVYRRLLGVVLTAQQRDGGWGDPMTTALAVRALLGGGGHGDAVDRGLNYLLRLQKQDGRWPRESTGRMDSDLSGGDSFASAFVLLQLGDRKVFRESTHFADAVAWFAAHAASLDPDARRLWSHAAVRCRVTPDHDMAMFLWPEGRPAA
jgi:hypothetical protein